MHSRNRGDKKQKNSACFIAIFISICLSLLAVKEIESARRTHFYQSHTEVLKFWAPRGNADDKAAPVSQRVVRTLNFHAVCRGVCFLLHWLRLKFVLRK